MNALVRRLAQVYRAATLSSGTSAASLGERVSGSKPGSAHLSFDGDEPVTVRMEKSLARWLDVWEREVEGGVAGVVSADRTSARRKAQTKAVLGEVGLDPTAVAFMYGMTTESVRRLRGRHARDPETGQRVTELRAERVDGKASTRAPLTAPGRAALQRLEERTADGEVGT